MRAKKFSIKGTLESITPGMFSSQTKKDGCLEVGLRDISLKSLNKIIPSLVGKRVKVTVEAIGG